jgi:hypothetical protein
MSYVRGIFMSEIIKSESAPLGPDNTISIDVNGTTMVIKEFFACKETVNEIIAKRIKREMDANIPSGDNG